MPHASLAPLRVSDLPKNRPTAFDLAPDAPAMAALAERLELNALRKLGFKGSLEADADGAWRLRAHLGATVVQPCIVTLAPVTTRIDETVTRRFLPHLPEEDSDADEIEMPEDETIDRLGAEIDLGQVMEEALALALPLYPRAADAQLQQSRFTEPGKAPMTDEDARPFAGLKALLDKLEGDG